MLKPTRFIIVASTIFLIVIVLDILEFELLSSTIELTLVPIITLLYLFLVKDKSKRLTGFFIIYSIADIINIIDFDAASNWSYYVCNVIYIIAYFSLILYIIKSLNFKLIFKQCLLDFLVLLVLDIFMIYVLINIVNPIDFETQYVEAVQVVEFLYSLILIIALSLSFLNYVQNVSRMYLFLFIACNLIAFSELILIGYYYIIQDVRLNYISTVLFVSGTILLFYHAINTSRKEQIIK